MPTGGDIPRGEGYMPYVPQDGSLWSESVSIALGVVAGFLVLWLAFVVVLWVTKPDDIGLTGRRATASRPSAVVETIGS